jgi:disulfide bond formation protein DsbB
MYSNYLHSENQFEIPCDQCISERFNLDPHVGSLKLVCRQLVEVRL